MPEKILIVDFNVNNGSALKYALNNEYAVMEAQYEEEALNIIVDNYNKITLIIWIVDAKETNDFGFLKSVCGDTDLSQTPVIIVCDEIDENLKFKALSIGAKDFITQSHDYSLIKQCVRSAINVQKTTAVINAIQLDKLTGLYNRDSFFEKATQMVSEHEPGYYIMACLDIDNFKLINDQYGAEEGDYILRHIGKTAKAHIKAVHGICSRISADNFAALYPCGEQEIGYITKMCEKDLVPHDSHAVISFSIGRYVVEDMTLSAGSMYDRAYIAKQSVKGRYDSHTAYFDESMREKLIREQEIISDMDVALSLKQFEVWFQPQFNHSSGALVGAEALVRWNHPKKGLIFPVKFIHVFERNGFIYELDKYVWEQICFLLRKWIDEGISPLPISVNISRYDVFKVDLMDTIIGLINKYDIPINLVRLEVTESAFTQSSEQIINVVKAMIDYGFVVEIDDFGSGYSSLNTLKDVPADVLKLDMRFLESNGNSQRGGNILESVVRMAKWLGISVIAEGVETIAQADFLKSIGCNYVQGYLYARPMPVNEYELILKKSSKEDRLLSLETVENLDNNKFWDPKSMDTLIFNSFIGGACIFEYYNGKIELLRANEKYAKVIGIAGMTIDDALKLSWSEHLDAENLRKVKYALQCSINTKDEYTDDFVFRNLPGCPEKTYLRSTVRVIASAGERHLVYCMNENITAEKQAEQAFRESDEQLRFLNEAAHDLLAETDTDAGINNVLRKLLHYFDAGRAYIFEFDFINNVTSNTYEVCSPGVTHEKEHLQNIPIENVSLWIDAFKAESHVSIESVDSLDDSSISKKVLQMQSIKSLIAVALRQGEKLIGFLGVDDPKSHKARLERLSALGDYLSAIFTRRDLTEKISNDRKMLTTLMDDTPGGFCRMKVAQNKTARLVYANDGFCRLVGMTRDEVMALYSENSLAGLHPDDIVNLVSAYREMMNNDGQYHAKYRLRHGNGGYIWVMVFGRLVKTKSGEMYLNSYYTDMSEQIRIEEQQKELLDNLPCGAALYEFDGKDLSVVHLNKRYRELVKRKFGNLSGLSPINAIHPDDREKVIEEVKTAIIQNRDANIDIRILYGKSAYKPFQITGRIIPKSGGKFSVYAAYMLLNEEEISYREMIPVALSAVMKSSDDFSFVKDKNLKYICCSSAFLKMIGCNDGDCVGKTDYDLLPKPFADKFTYIGNRVIETKQAQVNYEEALPMNDGNIIYANTSNYPLLDTFGNVIGIYGVSRDITEVRTAFKRLKLLTDNIPGGLVSFEVNENSWYITYFNEGFYSFSGYSYEEYTARIKADPLFLIFEEDKKHIIKMLELIRSGKTEITDCIYRCKIKDGTYRWFSMKGAVSGVNNNSIVVNAVQFDITDQKEAEELLRIGKEQFRIAAALGDRTVARYDIKNDIYYNDSELLLSQGFSDTISNIPQSFIDTGIVADRSVGDFCNLYQKLKDGVKSVRTTVELRVSEKEYRWFRMEATNVFDSDGKPMEAILVLFDVTEQREKEAVYKKWQQSLQEKALDSYTLFRCNLNKNASFDSAEGTLLKIKFSPMSLTFNDRTMEYARKYVYFEDRKNYMAILNSDTMLANYYRGKRVDSFEYREKVSENRVRWLKLSIELVEYPNSNDIEAFLMYEDIDEYKKDEILTKELARTDPLTGVLNRNAFSDKMQAIISNSKRDERHAFLMLDIDGFKQINDGFGHAAGDEALVKIARSLRCVLGQGDLLGRLGGDEFLLCLKNVPDDKFIAYKAERMCALVRSGSKPDIKLSVSIGIAVYPSDGKDFDALYHRADTALYRVKENGKDNFGFYASQKTQNVE